MASGLPAEETFRSFIARLASAERTPASGAVAGLLVAEAAALLTMCCRASRGRWDGAPGTAAQSESLRHQAISLTEAALKAHGVAIDALQGDVGSAVDPDWHLGRSLGETADALVQIAELGHDVAQLGSAIADEVDPDVRADVVGAVLFATAAVDTTAHLIEINLVSTPGDERVVVSRELASGAAEALPT